MNRCPLCESFETQDFLQVETCQYRRCRICDLTFLDREHRLAPAEEKARYELHENNPEDPKYREFLDRLMRPMLGKLTQKAAGIDYGSGPGPTLSVMFEEKGHPMAIYDPFFAEDEQPLKQQYDFVTCTETAEHFFEPRREFERMDDLLRPKGWLGVMTELVPEKEKFEKWYYRTDPTHVSFYSKKSFEWLAAQLGWNFEEAGRSVFLFQKRVN